MRKINSHETSLKDRDISRIDELLA